MQGLNQQTLRQLPDSILRAEYRREDTEVGIVHIGPGAFHRAHQAYYTELALAHGGHWAISAISMNSPGVADALNPQDGLYTLATLDIEQSFRVVSAIKEILHLPTQRALVRQRLVSKDVRVMTLTVTEKGYCLNAYGKLDLDNQAIQADINTPEQPQTAIGLVAYAMQLRNAAGLEGLSIISCDNVSDNGHKLKQAVADFLAAAEVANRDALLNETHFPNTMVDCITPASDDELKDLVMRELGVTDAWPIKREAFSQWVIEKVPGMQLPNWEAVGVTLTDNIDAYENAKLRILNLSHSALAYLGPLYHCDTVFKAIRQPQLKDFVESLLVEEVIPSIHAPAELDLQDYKTQTLERFRNPNIRHLLSQIAYDGTQKLRIRSIPVLQANLQAGRSVDGVAVILTAWARFAVQTIEQGGELVDPLRGELENAVVGQSFGASFDLSAVSQVLKAGQLVDDELLSDAVFAAALQRAISHITSLG